MKGNRTTMRTQSTILAAAAALCIAAPATYAQSAGPPQGTKPVLISTYKVKPGQVSDFEEVIRKYRDAQEKAGEHDLITVLSGRERTDRMLDELRERVGDNPLDWLPALLEAAE